MVVAIEFVAYSKRPSVRVLCSIVVLLLGIAMATITDSQVASNPLGMFIALANIFVTALYQVGGITQERIYTCAQKLVTGGLVLQCC